MERVCCLERETTPSAAPHGKSTGWWGQPPCERLSFRQATLEPLLPAGGRRPRPPRGDAYWRGWWVGGQWHGGAGRRAIGSPMAGIR